MIEIVTIGDELLLGHTIDTNAAYLSEQLAHAGLRVSARATVGDDEEAIRNAVLAGLRRTGVVITTGGLGPTDDDFTKETIAELYGRPLVLDEVYLEKLRVRWQQRGLRMPETNRSQAEIPEGAQIVRNPLGSAQGMALYDEKLGLTIMLPGVPHEVRAMTTAHLIPFLLQHITPSNPIRYRLLRTTGIPESQLAEQIADIIKAIEPIHVAFLPAYAGSDLRLTSWALWDERTAEQHFDRAEAMLRQRLGTNLYATGTDDLATVTGELLRQHALTLALAESCTGGLLGKRVTDVSGASDYFTTGFVTYANEAKTRWLNVDEALLRAYGAVSREVAEAMAVGARLAANSDVALSITGIAGPTGGSEAKPVGTVWAGLATEEGVRSRHFIMPGDREEIRQRGAQMALALLYEYLVGLPA